MQVYHLPQIESIEKDKDKVTLYTYSKKRYAYQPIDKSQLGHLYNSISKFLPNNPIVVGNESIFSRLFSKMDVQSLKYLSSEDLTILRSISVKLQFKKDQYIIQEGKKLNSIFILVNGSCKIQTSRSRIAMKNSPKVNNENDNSNTEDPSSIIIEGEIFGELEFLLQNEPICSVVANKSTVTIESIAYEELKKLFEKNSDFMLRFFLWITIALADKIQRREGK